VCACISAGMCGVIVRTCRCEDCVWVGI